VKSKLVVLAGPSGVGKGTVVRELVRQKPEVFLSVSATTRKPRPEENHDDHYMFLTREARRTRTSTPGGNRRVRG